MTNIKLHVMQMFLFNFPMKFMSDERPTSRIIIGNLGLEAYKSVTKANEKRNCKATFAFAISDHKQQ